MSQLLFDLLVIACALGVALQVGVIIINANRRNNSRHERQVIATVIRVQVESTTWTRGWCILAAWTDPQTGQIYTFRSPLLRYPPRQRAGDPIPVVIDTSDPRHFHIEFH